MARYNYGMLRYITMWKGTVGYGAIYYGTVWYGNCAYPNVQKFIPGGRQVVDDSIAGAGQGKTSDEQNEQDDVGKGGSYPDSLQTNQIDRFRYKDR